MQLSCQIILDLIAENKLLEAEKKRLQRLLEDAVGHLNDCCQPVAWHSGPLAMGKNWHEKESRQHLDSSNAQVSGLLDDRTQEDRQSYEQQRISDALSQFALHQSSEGQETGDSIHILHRAKALASRLRTQEEVMAEDAGSPQPVAEQAVHKKKRRHRLHKRSIKVVKRRPT